ncbi:MAG: CBS domain-containing protein, partial [Candidatus Binatia bacterium]
LHAVIHETRALKAHGQPQALGLAMAIAGALPSATGPLLVALSSRYPAVHTVCTNVPGPRGTRYLLGRRVLAIHPIVPIGIDMGLGFAILSYERSLSISVTADPALAPDVEQLPAALQAAADELHAILGTRTAVTVAPPTRAPTVADLMSRTVVTIGPESTLAEAWKTVDDARIRHLPVVDARGVLLGIVTHRDLLAAAQSRITFPDEGDRLRMLTWVHVADVMETHLSVASPTEAAADAGRRMATQKIGCLPVVDGGSLVGLVTDHDFLRWATTSMERPAA